MDAKKQKKAGIPKDGNTLKTFAYRLNDEMGKHKPPFNQKTLADEVGISQQTVQAYLAAETSPKIENLVAIAQALGVSCDYLAGNSDTPSTDINIRETVKKYGLSEEALGILEKSASGRILWGGVHPLRVINTLLGEIEPNPHPAFPAPCRLDILCKIGEIIFDTTKDAKVYKEMTERINPKLLPIDAEMQLAINVVELNRLLVKLRDSIIAAKEKAPPKRKGVGNTDTPQTPKSAGVGSPAKTVQKTTNKKKGA